MRPPSRAAPPAEEPEHEREHDREQDRRAQREVEPEAVALHGDVAGEAAEPQPGEPLGEEQQAAHRRHAEPGGDQALPQRAEPSSHGRHDSSPRTPAPPAARGQFPARGSAGRPARESSRPVPAWLRSLGGGTTMLWTITVILLVLWALGLASGSTLGAWVHI